MDLHSLRIFRTVAEERSFSRAAGKVFRTQPAVSLAVRKLEDDLHERLIDRSGKDVVLTDAGRLVLDYAHRFESLEQDLSNLLNELKDVSAGRLSIGANETTTLYLLQHIVRYRHLYPKVHVEIRRCLSSQIPAQVIAGHLELGVISFDPMDDRLTATVIYSDHLAFVVSPQHRFAQRTSVSVTELGMENFIAHNVRSPYREVVLKEFAQRKVPINIELEMPTVESIRKLVQRNEGVAFLPRMCVEQELQQRTLCEVKVEELSFERNIRLIYPSRRQLSHAAGAFLEIVHSRQGSISESSEAG